METEKPNIEIVKTFPPQKGLQQFRFAKVVTITCARCSQEKTSKLIAIIDNDWAKKICNSCYGILLSNE